MVKEIVPTYQEYDPSESISAGSFEKNPMHGKWWQRINPFTPSDPYLFKPSDEGQKIVDHFRSQYGKNINIQPNAPDTKKEVAGYFRPMGKGGSFDPRSRTVYLDKEHPTAFTLGHELGHAFDPNLMPFQNAGIEQGVEAGDDWNKNKNASEFLTKFAGKGGLHDAVFRAEVEAQKQGANVYDQYGFSDQDRNNDLGIYPYQYVGEGIESAEEFITRPNAPKDLHQKIMTDRTATVNPLGPRQVPYNTKYDLGMTHPNTFFDYSNQDLMSQLGLSLDQDYQKAKMNIQHTAKDYIKEQLGDNSNPIKRTPKEELSAFVESLGY